MGEKPKTQSPPDETVSEPVHGLPYDPDEWARRLEKAREARARSLKERESSKSQDTAPAPAVFTPNIPRAVPEPKSPPKLPTLRATRADSIGGVRPPARPAAPDEGGGKLRFWRAMAIAAVVVAILCLGVAIGIAWTALRLVPDANALLGPDADAAPPSAAVAPVDKAPVAQTDIPVFPGDIAGPGGNRGGPGPDFPDRNPSDAGLIPAVQTGPPEMDAAMDGLPSPRLPGAAPNVGTVSALPGTETATDPELPAGTSAEENAPMDADAREFVIHSPPSVGRDERDALAGRLDATPHTVGDPVTVNLTIGETHLRYYHAEDFAAAREVADILGVQTRDFTSYRPSPRPGMVEIWMEGVGSGTTGRSTSRRAAEPDLPQLFRRLSRRLRELQR